MLSLQNDQQLRQGTSWIYSCIPDLPPNVSANGCHLQGVVGALYVMLFRMLSMSCTFTLALPAVPNMTFL
jgi:hypothetical protein